MPKMRFKATKMIKPKADMISLVERGANRIPFKIMKQENEMKVFDLGSIFTRKSEKGPEVVGVVTMKGDKFDAVKDAIVASGFDVADVQEHEDGSVVFKQGDMEGETTVVRISDELALITKGFSPYSMDLSTANGESFAEACAAQGFFPGVNTVMEVLSQSVRETLYSAKTPSEAASGIDKLFREAGAYVKTMVSSLPVKAFKMEQDIPVSPITKQDDEQEQDSGNAPAGEATTDEAKADEGEGAVDNGGEGEGSPEGGAEDNAAANDQENGEQPVQKSEDSLTPEKVSDMVADKVGEALSGVTATMQAITTALEQVQKAAQDSTEAIKQFGARLDDAEKVAKSAKEAVSGVVVGGVTVDDRTISVRKSETSVMGEIDTAFQPRVRSRRSI